MRPRSSRRMTRPQGTAGSAMCQRSPAGRCSFDYARPMIRPALGGFPIRRVYDVWVVAVVLAACGGAAHPAAREGRHTGHPHGPLGRRFLDPEVEAREWDDPSRDAWQRPEEVIALMAIHPGMVVADLGAGTGYFIGRLSRAT